MLLQSYGKNKLKTKKMAKINLARGAYKRLINSDINIGVK